MEITNVNATNVSTDSWGEFVEFPLVTVMSKFDEYNNADGDNPHLHFTAASTNAPMAEYFPIPDWYKERQREAEDRDSTYADAIYANPPNAENGTIPLPDGTGTSSELNREALEHFNIE